MNIEQELFRHKKTVEDLISSDIKFKGRLERDVMIMLVIAIVEMIAYQAGVLSGFLAMIGIPILIACSVHMAFLIRNCDARLQRSEESLLHAKKMIDKHVRGCDDDAQVNH